MVWKTTSWPRPVRLRRGLLALIGLGVFLWAAAPAAGANQSSDTGHWLGVWATAQQPPHVGLDLGPASATSEAGFDNQTLRLLIYPTFSGDQLRIRLSKTFGAQPLIPFRGRKIEHP